MEPSDDFEDFDKEPSPIKRSQSEIFPPIGKEKNKQELISWVLTGFENHHQLSIVDKSYQRFVPNDFISKLGNNKNILNVDITDMHMMVNSNFSFLTYKEHGNCVH